MARCPIAPIATERARRVEQTHCHCGVVRWWHGTERPFASQVPPPGGRGVDEPRILAYDDDAGDDPEERIAALEAEVAHLRGLLRGVRALVDADASLANES